MELSGLTAVLNTEMDWFALGYGAVLSPLPEETGSGGGVAHGDIALV